MFIGHYSVALAARSIERRTPLWAYFLAVQWVDILWCVLVLLGVERVHIQPGVNPSSPLVFDYYPYSHSLVAGILWGVAAFGLCSLIARGAGSRRAAVVLGLGAGACSRSTAARMSAARPTAAAIRRYRCAAP
jgi:hypothetical protein